MVHSPAERDDAIDREDLRRIADRFREDQRARLARLRSGLDAEQSVLFDALPLLIHVNHPTLPGFVDFATPAGIDGYTPDRVAIEAARHLALGYAPDGQIEHAAQVQAVLVEPVDADGSLRVWVCSRETHDTTLQRKLAAIGAHAKRLGLALSSLLVDPLAVRARPATLGQTPALTLDRFYLNALCVAGRHPLWWLVPCQHEGNYAEYVARLLEHRVVSSDETFDFGPAPGVPYDEWLVESVEQLERAIHDPFGALRTLQLIEARASTSPLGTPGLLASAYKRAIQNDDRDSGGNGIDAATLTRIEVERYLAATESQERLAYARRLLSGEPGVDPTWSLARRIEEGCSMQRELEHALDVAVSIRTRVKRLSRDLDARLQCVDDALRPDPSANTLPTLHPALLAGSPDAKVTIDRFEERWRVREGRASLFAATRLASIAAWLHAHRVAVERLLVEDTAALQKLTRMLDVMRASGRTRAPVLLVLLNAEHEPTLEQRAADAALPGEWDDPLDSSGSHDNLIASVDRVELGERPACDGADGASGLFCALERAFHADTDLVHYRSIGLVRTRAIEDRVRDLVAELQAAFHADSAAGRFVFPTGAAFTVVTRSPSGFLFASAPDLAGLYATLRAPLPAGRPITLADSRSRRLGWLRRLSELVEVGRPTLLIAEEKGGAENVELVLHLSDQDGSIHRFPVPGRTVELLAGELTAFFARQRFNAAAAPKLYSSTARGLEELRVAPLNSLPRLALRVRREPGRVDIHHGERRWSNVPIVDSVLDELIAALGPRRGQPLLAAVGEVAFESDILRLPELLALKLGFERRLLERSRA